MNNIKFVDYEDQANPTSKLVLFGEAVVGGTWYQRCPNGWRIVDPQNIGVFGEKVYSKLKFKTRKQAATFLVNAFQEKKNEQS